VLAALQQLVSACTALDPWQRPTMQQVLDRVRHIQQMTERIRHAAFGLLLPNSPGSATGATDSATISEDSSGRVEVP
jgi:hypothetical protein